jgi:hypothetical protein
MHNLTTQRQDQLEAVTEIGQAITVAENSFTTGTISREIRPEVLGMIQLFSKRLYLLGLAVKNLPVEQ